VRFLGGGMREGRQLWIGLRLSRGEREIVDRLMRRIKRGIDLRLDRARAGRKGRENKGLRYRLEFGKEK
jgi:hypothetical protein